MSDNPDVWAMVHSPLVGGSFAGETPEEALAARDAANREWLDTAERRARKEQDEVDRALADGKAYVQLGSAVVHTLECQVVKDRFDRMAAWRAYLERIEAGQYNTTITPGPKLYHRHELEAMHRTRRRCEKCAPDIENWTKPSPTDPGTVITKQIKSVSLGGHHAGRTLILADGSEVGDVEAVYITVTTTTGTYQLERDSSVTLRHVVPE